MATKIEILKDYIRNLKDLQIVAEEKKISVLEFNKYLYFHHFRTFNSNPSNNPYNYVFYKETSKVLLKTVIERKKKILNFIFLLLTLFTLFSYKNECSTIVLRNIQSLIYPGMKMWRKMAVDTVLLHYPGVSTLYDESCLVQNPYFQVSGLNCQPCLDISNVLDLTNVELQISSTVPHIFKTQLAPVDVHRFFELYQMNEPIFKQDAYRVDSTNADINNLDELFQTFLNSSNQAESHSVWRCNRMAPARLLRSIFPLPSKFPRTGISLERYISVDTANAAPYRIPDAECSNMFLIQALGVRNILLRPTQECRSVCKTLSVRLPATYALVYNWWYWRPISVSEQYSTIPTISFIGSYC